MIKNPKIYDLKYGDSNNQMGVISLYPFHILCSLYWYKVIYLWWRRFDYIMVIINWGFVSKISICCVDSTPMSRWYKRLYNPSLNSMNENQNVVWKSLPRFLWFLWVSIYILTFVYRFVIREMSCLEYKIYMYYPTLPCIKKQQIKLKLNFDSC